MKRNSFLTIVITILSAVTFFACGTKQSADIVKVNSDIDANTRKQLSELNKKLFQSIMTGDTKAVAALSSEQLIKKAGGKLETLIQSTAKTFSATDFEVIDQFYSKHHVRAGADTLFTNKGNANDYMIIYKATNEEMYVSVLASKELLVNCMILVIYGKYDNEWKVNILQIGEYSIENKTAQDYFRAANKFFDAGEIVDASNAMVLTSQLATPAGNIFKYRNEDVMRDYSARVMESANKVYQYPVSIHGVKTGPQVFSISPQFISDRNARGVFPLIRYVSKIDLNNTAALKAENDAIQKVIGNVFIGLDKNNQFIYYQAVNAAPDGRTSTNRYGFVQKTIKN